MAIVIPAYKLEELLNCNELRAQREADLKEETKPKPGAKLDLADKPKQFTLPKKGEPIEMPIPSRKQFENDLAKATRRKKPSE